MSDQKIEFNICAGWEDQGAHLRCRWFLVWAVLDCDDLVDGASEMIAGVYAGYSGGGTFNCEEFRAETAACEVYTLWSDEEDRVSGQGIDWEANAGTGVNEVCKVAWDLFRDWIDYDEWCESDYLWLRTDKSEELGTPNDDGMVYFNSREFSWEELETIRELCSVAGLTGGPVS